MIRIAEVSVDYARSHGEKVRRTAADSPAISWAAESSRTGDSQCAYRITAAGWDSGWVESPERSARIPAGTLKRGVPETVTVAVRTAAGDESAEYKLTVCDVRRDWDAAWIADPEAKAGAAVYMRKRFCLNAAPVAARLYVCGIGYQDVSVNGAPVGYARLDPANTDYSKRTQYAFYTLDDMNIAQGENELRVTVGPGWRNINSAWLRKDAKFEGASMLTAVLEIDTADGKTTVIKTGSDWETGAGPIKYANIFNGEHYDANIAPDFSRSAAEVAGPGGKMEPMLIPPIVAKLSRAPLAAWPDGDNAVMLDFGQNIAGVLSISLPAGMAKGHTITALHSEELTEDGKLFRDTLRAAKNEDVYIASGEENDGDVWTPIFTYHGFRYARVEGITAAEAYRINAVELRTDVDSASVFTCGDPLLTKIHDIAVATERANIHSILTDCPQRDERLGWMNDATVRFEETPYNFDIGALFPKVIRDIIDAQGPEGGVTCTAPFAAGFEAAMHTGNLDIIREAYPAFKAWEDCLLANSDDYIVNYSYYGDWAGPADCCVPGDGVNPGAQSAVTPGIFMSTGYSYFNCTLLSKFAGWLGDAAEEKKYAELAEKIKAALIDKWYDAETGEFATGSQACLAFPLWLGIAPDPVLTAKRLHEAVESAGWRLTTGNLCSRYIMDALTDNGYVDAAMRLMTRDEYPSIGFMIQQEATTVWERFELMKAPGMNSHDHPMYGAVDYWMFAHIAGVKCKDFGWKKFSVKPYLPEKLMSAQATIDTSAGKISVRWTKRYGGKHLQLQVPFGTEAEIDFCGVKKTVGSGFHTITVAD